MKNLIYSIFFLFVAATQGFSQTNHNPPTIITSSNPCGGGAVLEAITEANSAFLWSTGATTNIITVTASGTYTVIVTYSDGMTATATTTVTVTMPPVVCPFTYTVDCAARTIGFSFPAGSTCFNPMAYNYSWSANGVVFASSTAGTAASPPIFNMPLGSCNDTFNICVTQSLPNSNCTTQYCTSVVPNCFSPVITYNVDCANNLKVTGVSGYPITTTFNWILRPCNTASPVYYCSNAHLGDILKNNLAAGCWQLCLDLPNCPTNCQGACTTITVGTSSAPIITFNGATTVCCNAANSITASSNSTTGATYLWSNGSTSPVLTLPANSLPCGTSTTFTVTVTNSTGCATTASVVITTTPPPTPTITVTGTTCPRTLTASGGGTYLWNTGATTATLSAANSGTYTVTVTNTAGCTATASVTVDCCNLQISELRSLIYVHAQAVTFPTPTVTGCTTGSTLTYLWEFGDGTTSTLASPTKTYTTIGIYNVCLTVTCTAANGTFCRAKCCREVNIGKNCPALYPTFAVNMPATGLAYTFTGTIQSTSVLPAPISTYEIYNSTNTLVTTLTGTNATYSFPNSGEYSVCRNLAYVADATYGAACTAKNCRKITVMPTTGCNATAKFVATTYKANPLNVTFNASSYSTGATAYYWEYSTSPTGTFTQLGTAANAALGTPTFLFPTAGVYWVRLTLNKGTACETAIIARINLNAFTCTASSSTTPAANRSVNPDGSIEVGNSDINDGIGLYPNPTDSNVTITFGNDIKATTLIKVYDMKGQLITSFRTQEGDNQTVIDLSNQAAGMYLFHIENESGERLVKKVMKQ